MVDGIAHERVDEAERGLVPEDVGSCQRSRGTSGSLLLQVSESCDERKSGAVAEHRDGLGHRGRLSRKSVQAAQHGPGDRSRADLPDRVHLCRIGRHAVRFRRVYVSAAVECELDGSGRVLVPPHLREKAKLDKDAVWAGMGQRLELWSKSEWERALTMSDVEREELRAAMEGVEL